MPITVEDSRQPPADLFEVLCISTISIAHILRSYGLYLASVTDRGDGYVIYQIEDNSGSGKFISITVPAEYSIISQ